MISTSPFWSVIFSYAIAARCPMLAGCGMAALDQWRLAAAGSGNLAAADIGS
jgi:hypothetical protein